MPIVATLSSAARLVIPRFIALIKGSPDEQAELTAIAKAAASVAVALLELAGSTDEDRVTFVAVSLLETLGRADSTGLQEMPERSARRELLDRLEAALSPLDDKDVGFSAMGIDVEAAEVARMFVDELTENLLLWGSKGAQVRDLALRLRIEKLEADPSMLALSDNGGAQVRRVRAWITVESDPPQIEVYNDGDGSIFDVVPTPMLVAKDLSGKILTMVGGAPLANSRASQISPGYGYCWPLPHMGSWSAQPLVSSQLHLDFTDSGGHRYRYAHGQITRIHSADGGSL